ncbi:BQ2448_7953 [Microbotryum intermedium]|uniref:BQ2448_7953 protein n=1 Tax=Microbotryum intermedium TaxID=269621 RepID=A0A238FSU4_9BASI|nr:BQ2448_7953 [Microbotryum intermedium]
MTIREYVSVGSVAHVDQPERIKKALSVDRDQVVDPLADGWESYASGMVGSSLSTSEWKLAAVVNRLLPPPTFELLDPTEESSEDLAICSGEDVTSSSIPSSGSTMVGSLDSLKEETKRAVRIGTTAYPTMVEGEEVTIHFPNHSAEARVLSGGQVSLEKRDSLFRRRDNLTPLSRLALILQWQRITLARSFMNLSPDLLVWDEPMVPLDPIAEARLYDEMLSRKGKVSLKLSTIIFTTHRLNICTKVDRVFVLEAGRLIEQGSHAELMQIDSTRGRYRQLWEAQSI